jgi:hypothetical protein
MMKGSAVKNLISSAAATVPLVIAAAVPAMACLAQPLSPSRLVTKADVIVRATAVKYVKTPHEQMVELDFSSDGNIQFQVEEVLKGDGVPAPLMIEGLLSPHDDFNDGSVPYHFIRPGGRGERCELFTYKQGAEFLLFLKRGEGKLTPYWAPLSPTNEQLRSPNDAWLWWVRSQLETVEQKETEVGRRRRSTVFGLSAWQSVRKLDIRMENKEHIMPIQWRSM